MNAVSDVVENPLAELLHQPCYKGDWHYIPYTANETA